MIVDQDTILKKAEELGLDPIPVEFHVVPAAVLYDMAARIIPGRYSHWSHGKSFYDGITRHDYKFSRIYELVINSDPCQAFLLDVNADIINTMVIAHVYGHSDFFKNNRAYKDSDRNMHLNAALRAERIRNYEQEYGEEEVRKVLDAALTVEFYVNSDGYDPTIKENACSARPYDELLDLNKKHERKTVDYSEKKRFAGLPCDDILHFLMTEAPIEGWKKDIISIVRSDGVYLWPNIRTHAANEGWASFVHSKIMNELDLDGKDFIEYAKINAGVVRAAENYINPYWLGVQIFKDIEKRLGYEKTLEVRKNETDASFLRNYLTEDLIHELKLIRYGVEGDYYVVKDTEWQKVRDGYINDLCSRFPAVYVADKNHDKQGALLLKHNHDGRNLKKYDAVMVLKHLEELWQNKVLLETQKKDKKIIWSADGGETEVE